MCCVFVVTLRLIFEINRFKDCLGRGKGEEGRKVVENDNQFMTAAAQMARHHLFNMSMPSTIAIDEKSHGRFLPSGCVTLYFQWQDVREKKLVAEIV